MALRFFTFLSIFLFSSIPFIPFVFADYIPTLVSPNPQQIEKTFVWKVSGENPAQGQKTASLLLSGCWTADKIEKAEARDKTNKLLPLTIHTSGPNTNKIQINKVNDKSVPLTITITFKTMYPRAEKGTTLVITKGNNDSSHDIPGPICTSPTTIPPTPTPSQNTPPAFTDNPVNTAQSIHVGEGLAPLEVTDEEHDPLIFKVTTGNLPDGIILDTDGTFKGTASSSSAGIYPVKISVADVEGATDETQLTITVTPQGNQLPPDPSTIAPPLDKTHYTSFAEMTKFLYTGSSPIQTGVEEGIIDAKRAAVLRGKVFTKDGEVLSGVKITIHTHPEFGQTLSRTDGMFDIAVNGGGTLVVSYEKQGYLPVQRSIDTTWRNYESLPNIIMLPLDIKVTDVDVSSSQSAMQVAQGSQMTDLDGSRQATILFPEGTTAKMLLSDGTEQSLSHLRVRATEYTVGSTGPNAMPANLPPTSGYTYAVELSIDEAITANAKSVFFNKPIPYYVENFLNFPIGQVVPVGYYDREKSQWIPSDNGRVIKIISVTNGKATIDIDGSHLPASPEALNALGITDAELEQLATLYSEGTSLWRVQLNHFTPFDLNWPYGPPQDATAPQQPDPEKDNKEKDPCKQKNSIIECQNQVLGEEVPIVGTPFSLNYRSDRVTGRKAANTLTIPITGTTPPASLKRIDLQLTIAGRQFTKSFSPEPNQKFTFTWDGLDAYGRKPNGKQLARIQLGYVYQAVYQQPAQIRQSFAVASGSPISSNRARQEITIWQNWQQALGNWDALGEGLGAWMLSAHNIYDPEENIVYFGDGNNRVLEDVGHIITTVAKIRYPEDVAVDNKGNMYVTSGEGLVVKILPDGTAHTIAGGGSDLGDGGPATAALLDNPIGIVVDATGNIFVADTFHHRIRKITPDGIITTFAGTGQDGFSGDDGPAAQANLGTPLYLALDNQGNLFVTSGNRIRKISPNGIINTIAGINGQFGFSGDGGPALFAAFRTPHGLSFDRNGNLLIVDNMNGRIRSISPDGIIKTIAGNGQFDYTGDGNLATDTALNHPHDIVTDANDNVFIADHTNFRIRKITSTGILTTFTGKGTEGITTDGSLANASSISTPNGVIMDNEGNLLFTDHFNHRLVKVSSRLPDLKLGDLVTPSTNGKELFYFDSSGRHTKTTNALTGALIYTFAYNNAGYLVSITDGDNNITTIERNTDDNPTAIVAPDGQRTTLALDANGYLETVTNPASESAKMTYTNDGLLKTFIDPKNNTSKITYDDLGRLTKDENAAGGSWTLERNASSSGYIATMTSALNRLSTYKVDNLTTGDRQWQNISPDGDIIQTLFKTNGTTLTTDPDGTIHTTVEGPDPRFGMQAPLKKTAITKTPSGLTSTVNITRTVSLSDPNNPLSLMSQTTQTTRNNKTMENIFMAASKQYTNTSPEGRQIITTIDQQERPTKIEINGLQASNYTYDTRGRLTAINQGDGTEQRVTTFTYNTQGFLHEVTDALDRKQQFEYDLTGRVTKQILPDGRTVAWTYDANGNVTSITPPGKPKHSFGYTPINQQESYTPPNLNGITNPKTTYEYNLDKQLTKITRPDGQTIALDYNAGGRLSKQVLPTSTTTYTYDTSTSQLKNLETSEGINLTYTYDGFLPVTETWDGPIAGTVTRTYNNDFKATSLKVNTDNIDFTYDNDNLLTKAGDLSLTYNTANELLTNTRLDSLVTTQTYNGFGELDQFTASNSATALFNVRYTHDKLGRIIEKSETIGQNTNVFTYTYDTVGRLTEVKKNGTTQTTYTYDANSNRLTQTDANGTANATYDDQDRLITYDGTTYTYTENGELKTKAKSSQTTSYTYDGLGNLTKVALPNNDTIEYVIDGRNRRIGKKKNGSITQEFLYADQLKPIAELNNNGEIVSRFVYGSKNTIPDYFIKNGTKYQIISDHLGSPRLIINTTNGTIEQEMDYDAFGNVIKDTKPGFQPFGFAGGLYDRETKLLRFGARDYDAETGRWTAKDPIGFDGGDINLYGYVMNDPINYADPNGNMPDIRTIIQVLGILIGLGGNPGTITEPYNPPVNQGEAIGQELPDPAHDPSAPSQLPTSRSAASPPSTSPPSTSPTTPRISVPPISTFPSALTRVLGGTGLLLWPSEIGDHPCELPGGPPCPQKLKPNPCP